MSFLNLANRPLLRRLAASAAVIAAALMPVSATAATTWGTDFTDLWWNADESGWGVNIVHQGTVVFLTLYVYAGNSAAKWYVAPAMGGTVDSNSYNFSGTLYETTGPYLGAMFDARDVVRREAGNAALEFLQGAQGNYGVLTYTVDGVIQTKLITRQTFRTNDLTGAYLGSTIGSTSGCGPNSGNFENVSQIAIKQVGTSIDVLTSMSNGVNCTFSGNHLQVGRMGRMSGAMSCTNGAVGTYAAAEIEAGHLGFIGRYQADYGGGCTESGRFGGIRR